MLLSVCIAHVHCTINDIIYYTIWYIIVGVGVGVGKEGRTIIGPWCYLIKQRPLLELP